MELNIQQPEQEHTQQVNDPDFAGVFYKVPLGWTAIFPGEPGRMVGAGIIVNGDHVQEIAPFMYLEGEEDGN